jgi:Xaa-Pro aminopeptidase
MLDVTAAQDLPPVPAVDAAELTTARRERLRQALAEAPFDALVLTAPESITYATGYRSVGSGLFRGHSMAAILTAEDCWLVAPASDTAPAAEVGVRVEHIVPFGRFYFEATEGTPLQSVSDRHAGIAPAVQMALREAIRAVGSRVAVEGAPGSSVPAAVSDELPDAPDATKWVATVRGCKLSAEVELLRHAARLAETGIARALEQARPGITEAELASHIAATMVAGGADPRFVVATVGERTALADTYPTQRAWQPGELARFDVGCVYGGYWSDMARTAVLGEPDRLMSTRYAALLAGEEEQLATARPGVTAGELFDTAVEVVQRYGPRPYRRHHCGHGIGLAVYEPPIIAHGVDTALRAGMTFCFETPYYELGWGGMMVEDTVVVTESGVERLTVSPRDLLVVNP